MIPYVYVDLDGVLVDFDHGVNQFFGLTSAQSDELNRVLASKHGWPKLQREWPTFWIDIPPMPNALALWRLVKPHRPSILTACPPSWPSAATGKHVWVKRHLPKFAMHPHEKFHAVLRPQKRTFARQPDGTPNILIDDYDVNITEWTASGGIGLHYTDGRAGLTRVAALLNTTFR